MKQSVYVVAAMLLIGTGAAQAQDQVSRWLSPEDPITKNITAVEKMWSDTSCAPATEMLNAAIADDFQGTSTKGERYGKAHATDQQHNRDCQLQQTHVRLFGDSLAMVYGNESSVAKHPDGKDWKRCLAWTDTWLKRNGKWQIIAAQDNVVACE
jgi:Domain of unknown function (DUF4440)